LSDVSDFINGVLSGIGHFIDGVLNGVIRLAQSVRCCFTDLSYHLISRGGQSTQRTIGNCVKSVLHYGIHFVHGVIDFVHGVINFIPDLGSKVVQFVFVSFFAFETQQVPSASLALHAIEVLQVAVHIVHIRIIGLRWHVNRRCGVGGR